MTTKDVVQQLKDLGFCRRADLVYRDPRWHGHFVWESVASDPSRILFYTKYDLSRHIHDWQFCFKESKFFRKDEHLFWHEIEDVTDIATIVALYVNT